MPSDPCRPGRCPPRIQRTWPRLVQHLATTLEKDEGFQRRFLGNPGQNALVRNTVSITVLEGAAKTNVAPASARAQLDARLLPGESCTDFAEAMRKIAELVSAQRLEQHDVPDLPPCLASAAGDGCVFCGS